MYYELTPTDSLLAQDVPALIRYPSRPTSTHVSHHLSTYRLATLISAPLAASLLLFWVITYRDPDLVCSWEVLPNLYLLVLLVCFFLPFHIFAGSGRFRFLSTLRRVSVGGIAETQDGKFGDVLMADALTSYAKVLGDLYISLCMFFSSSRSSTDKPDRQCGGELIVPLIITVPSMIRLRQCLIEFFRVRRANQRTGGVGSHGWGGQHLANALKYSTAFPVTILSAMQRAYDPDKIGFDQTSLFRLW